MAGPGALGGTPLGPAGAHGAGAIGAVLSGERTSAQEASPTGHARWSCNCAAGCRSGRWCWWGTTATLCSTCCTAASPCRKPVTLIARLRLDAALYAPAPPRQPGQNGRPALKGARRPSLKALLEQPPATDQPQVTWTSATVGWYDGATRTVELTSQTAVWYRSGKPPVRIRWVLIRDPQGAFAPQALLCTDPVGRPDADPGMGQILEWFVLRWQLEVTFQEVADPSGRGRPSASGPTWPSPAPRRSCWDSFPGSPWPPTPLQERHPMIQRRAAWYDKPSPTFVDAIALVRRHLWLASEGFPRSPSDPDTQELPTALYHRLVDSLAYAA